MHANKPLFSEINDHSHGSKTEQSQKNTDFQGGKKKATTSACFSIFTCAFTPLR